MFEYMTASLIPINGPVSRALMQGDPYAIKAEREAVEQSVLSQLNALGAEGWEYVGVIPGGTSSLFKRALMDHTCSRGL